MITSGINLVMAVVGFSLSIMFITFVCVRLICARIRMRSSRLSVGRAFGSDLTTVERSYRGLEPRILANFPTKKYRELCLLSKENAHHRCTICLSNYHDEDMLRFLLVCGHSFHARCIDIWLHQHFTCPVCRISLRDLPKKKWFNQHSTHHNPQHYCHCTTECNRHENESEGNANLEGTVKNSTSQEVASPSS